MWQPAKGTRLALAFLALTTLSACNPSGEGAGLSGRTLPAAGSVFALATREPDLRPGMDAREALASCLASYRGTARALRTASENYQYLRLAYEGLK